MGIDRGIEKGSRALRQERCIVMGEEGTRELGWKRCV